MLKLMRVLIAGTLAFVMGSAQAALIDRGGGLLYDNVLNITWLQDANYAKTSGYDIDGLMDWNSANVWAANLVYGGYSDWRLPTTLYPDPSGQSNGSYVTVENATGSELGSLFYRTLGNVGPSTDPINFGLVNSGLFKNLEADHGYWSQTEYAPSVSYAWYFHFASGFQAYSDKSNGHFALAARDGDVASASEPSSIPEPSNVMLLGIALAGLLAARRKMPC